LDYLIKKLTDEVSILKGTLKVKLKITLKNIEKYRRRILKNLELIFNNFQKEYE